MKALARARSVAMATVTTVQPKQNKQ